MGDTEGLELAVPKGAAAEAAAFARNARLPTTAAFLTGGLDGEEGRGLVLGKQTRKRNKRPLPTSGPQGSWAALEGEVKARHAARAGGALGARGVNSETDWHTIPVVKMTPELERDLRIVENRQHLDPKRFYKSSGTGRKKGELPTRVQVGVVVEGAHEFYSGRLTNRERRATIMDEVLADDRAVHYAKSRFQSLQAVKGRKRRVVDPAAIKKKKGGGRWH